MIKMLTDDQDAQKVRVTGASGQLADVFLQAGTNRLATDATVTVEELFGQDPIPDTYFRIDNAGNTNDTLRVQVAATSSDPSSPDRDVPAVDKTITVTASEAGDELALRDKVITDLNADSNFSASLKAQKVVDRAIVHVTSKFFSMSGEFYERPNTNDFQVTTTGSVSVTVGFDTIESRGKSTSLARDPDNPHRLGILGVAGSVQVTPGALSDLYIEHALNGASKNLLVNGSVTPVVFQITTVSNEDIFVESLRFHGSASTIKWGQFLAISTLTNGLLVEIKSDDTSFAFDAIVDTDDFKNEWNYRQPFELFDQPSSVSFTASYSLSTPFPLRATGTFSTDDYVKVTVRDNLISASLISLEFQAFGFKRPA
jgi:hypothetical protein